MHNATERSNPKCILNTETVLQTHAVFLCIRLSMQGADILCGLEEVVGHSVSPVTVRDLEALGEGRRYSVSDELLSAFLHGVRMCL